MSDLAQYIATILLNAAYSTQSEAIGGSPSGIRDRLVKDVGSSISVDDVSRALSILSEFAAAEEDHSPLTGGYWTISYDNFRYYFKESAPSEGDDPDEYERLRKKAELLPILNAYARRGANYAADAAAHLKKLPWSDWEELRVGGDVETILAPAADRIVRLDDNSAERDVIVDKIATLQEQVRAANDLSTSMETGRERALAELDAGSRLLKAPTGRLKAIWAVLGTVLTFIAVEFAGSVIGDLATELLTHLKTVLGL